MEKPDNDLVRVVFRLPDGRPAVCVGFCEWEDAWDFFCDLDQGEQKVPGGTQGTSFADGER